MLGAFLQLFLSVPRLFESGFITDGDRTLYSEQADLVIGEKTFDASLARLHASSDAHFARQSCICINHQWCPLQHPFMRGNLR